VFFVFMWLRGTLPRIRVDQMHNMNWKFLVPVSIVHLVVVMALMKLFVTSPAQVQANGGILVTPSLQAAILFTASMAILIGSLVIAARRARIMRLQEEAILEQRRAENIAAVSV